MVHAFTHVQPRYQFDEHHAAVSNDSILHQEQSKLQYFFPLAT